MACPSCSTRRQGPNWYYRAVRPGSTIGLQREESLHLKAIVLRSWILSYAICWTYNYAFRLRKRRVHKRQCPKCYSTQLAHVNHPAELNELGLRKGKDLQED